MTTNLPTPGTRVRVTLESEVVRIDGPFFHIGPPARINVIDPEAAHVVSVEYVASPVVTFKPGDRVRDTHSASGYEYTIGRNGYYDHTNNLLNLAASTAQFTSERYELVQR